MKKLTMVRIYARGRYYTQFIEATVSPDGKIRLTWQALCDMFPILTTLQRGETWSHG